MNFFKKISNIRGIRIRILAPVILCFIAGASVMLFLHDRSMEDISHQSGLKQANTLLESVRMAIDFPMKVGDAEGVRRILTGMKDSIQVYVADHNGLITYGPTQDTIGKKLQGVLPGKISQLAEKTINSGSSKSVVDLIKEGDTGEVFGMRLMKNEKQCFHCHGASRDVLGIMVMRSDISSIVKAENSSMHIMTAIIFAAVLLAIPLITFILNRSAITPIKNLAERLKELATGEADLTKQLNVKAVNCSEIMNCGKSECPSYGKDSHCWYEAGSYAADIHCPKILDGTYSSCDQCTEVYQRAIVTEVDEAATFVNAFIARTRELIRRAKNNAVQVGREADKVSAESVQMASIAEDTNRDTALLLNSSEVTTDMVNSVVSAMEEMNLTVVEIAQNTSKSREMALDASDRAAEAEDIIKHLSEVSDKIGEISQLIGSIAEQTNLLALNATIEAARAGDAGKGFAVVANEVKELAKQTGDSVIGIDESVQGLKNGVNSAVESIRQVVQVIESLSEMSESIASAVEEQTATTAELSENAQNTGQTVIDMTSKIKEIAVSSEKAKTGSTAVKDASEELQVLFKKLQSMLGEFKV
ncbi:MAG: hypothetical protein DSZ23_05135 [Thermodesulfatator sp.]|nr:MAG: hypothetical protein DSZ23_05135 [Thermodesulfatator sp.]